MRTVYRRIWEDNDDWRNIKINTYHPAQTRTKSAHTCAITLQQLVGRTSHEFISITEIFGDSLVPCILLMFSPVFPKCSNAQYRAQERNSDPALLFRRRLTCMTQRSGCLNCGSSRYSTTCMRTCLPCSILLA